MVRIAHLSHLRQLQLPRTVCVGHKYVHLGGGNTKPIVLPFQPPLLVVGTTEEACHSSLNIALNQ